MEEEINIEASLVNGYCYHRTISLFNDFSEKALCLYHDDAR
jgi:hypothetical protein